MNSSTNDGVVSNGILSTWKCYVINNTPITTVIAIIISYVVEVFSIIIATIAYGSTELPKSW